MSTVYEEETPEEIEEIFCEKCGKSMTDHYGGHLAGFHWTFSVDADAPDDVLEFVKKQLGKYAVGDGCPRDINLCMECFLDTYLPFGRRTK